MLWMQLGVSFFAWIAFGVSLWRGYYRSRKPNNVGRGWRIVRAVSVMLLSIVMLFVGIVQLQNMAGISEGSLTLVGWIFISIVGAVFVAMQVDAVDTLLSLVFEDVTMRARPASDPREGKKEE